MLPYSLSIVSYGSRDRCSSSPPAHLFFLHHDSALSPVHSPCNFHSILTTPNPGGIVENINGRLQCAGVLGSLVSTDITACSNQWTPKRDLEGALLGAREDGNATSAAPAHTVLPTGTPLPQVAHPSSFVTVVAKASSAPENVTMVDPTD